MADPGFPRGGGANSPGGGGAPTYDFAKFSQKLHEIERIWTPGGRPSRPPSLDPPLIQFDDWTESMSTTYFVDGELELKFNDTNNPVKIAVLSHDK